jgi:hypothetical protein
MLFHIERWMGITCTQEGVNPRILDNLPRIVQGNQPTPLADPPDQGQGQLLEGGRRKEVRSRVRPPG